MKNNLTYTLCGDYYIPNIKLSCTEPIEWNRFSRMARTYLKEHRPILYNCVRRGGGAAIPQAMVH